MSLALIDSDILCYQAIASTEQEIDWGDDVWTLYTDLKQAKDVFNAAVDNITNKLRPDDILHCLSDHQNNFRKQVDPTYKSNRKGTRKPVGYKALRDWIVDTYPSMTMPNLEADDVMGILATKPENIGKCVVVSSDKDLKTVPCKLYRPMQDELLEITEAEADRYFFHQTLTGDTTDGYKGCAGVGEKTATKILGNKPTWSLVEQAFLKAGMTQEQALQQARLARILRWSDWDEDKETVKLWQP